MAHWFKVQPAGMASACTEPATLEIILWSDAAESQIPTNTSFGKTLKKITILAILKKQQKCHVPRRICSNWDWQKRQKCLKKYNSDLRLIPYKGVRKIIGSKSTKTSWASLPQGVFFYPVSKAKLARDPIATIDFQINHFTRLAGGGYRWRYLSASGGITQWNEFVESL